MPTDPTTHARARTQHIIAPCTRMEHRPARIEPAGTNISLARIPEDRMAMVARTLESCRGEIVERLALGAVGWESEGRRHVLLWDLMDISVAMDGADVRVAWPHHEPEMGVCLATTDLSEPIGAYRWAAAFDPVLFGAWRRHGRDTRMLGGGATGEWTRRTLVRTFRRYVDWNRLRRGVLAYLRLEPLDLALTRRIFDSGQVPIDRFDWVHRHSRELARVAIEHPRLLPFLRIVSRIAPGTPIGNFESLLHDAGITPPARAKLEKWGWEIFDAASESALFSGAESLVADFANLLDRLQLEEPPPSIFAALALDIRGRPHPDWFLRALLEELDRLEHFDLPDLAPHAWGDAIDWLESDPPDPDENQRRAGWPWIEAQAEWHATTRDLRAVEPWPLPCAQFESGPWRVVPIRNRAELAEEADAMRNCLASFAADCEKGRCAVLSIRDRESGRRVACLSLSRPGHGADWELDQVAGKGNAKVEAPLIRLAMSVAKRCEEIQPSRQMK
jgi:hypothetical protein